MLQLVTILLAVFLIGYALALFLMSWRLLRHDRTFTAEKPTVSIVVAARNESRHIPGLLRVLTQQDYPNELMEIILVDDASEDETVKLVRDFCFSNDSARITLLHAQNRDRVVSPKKNALEQGIQQAAGAIILLTDADCLPPKTWVSRMTRYFTPQVGIVIGFSPVELPALRSISDRLLALDALALGAIAAGTTELGIPATCSGRNLAYRRVVFQQVGGFSKINHFVSGDDDLLLQLVHTETEWGIRYALDPATVVPTFLLQSWSQFYQQRIRHASKGLRYQTGKVIALFSIYLFNVALFIALLYSLLSGFQYIEPIVIFGLKSLAETVLLGTFACQMKNFSRLSVFPIAALLHMPYVILFGALGQFARFHWKSKKGVTPL